MTALHRNVRSFAFPTESGGRRGELKSIMKNVARLCSLGAALGLATALSAQPSGGPRGHGPGRPGGRGHGGPGSGHPIVRALDTDKDGTLSASEIANASASI